MGIDAEMLVKTRADLSESDIRKLSARVAAAFGHSKFFIQPEKSRHALERVDSYYQDGPEIQPDKGETFVRVNMWTRYYGTGYERGDAVFILALARWLEDNVPGASVFYGGDSSGVCAEPFDAAAREELWRHFSDSGHEPYRGGFSMRPGQQCCDFCGGAIMTECRWGAGDVVGYICDGCNLHRLVSGDTVTESRGEWPGRK